MTIFQQITAQRREQRRYEKRVREQAMAVYRAQVKLAQEQGRQLFGDYVSSAISDFNTLDPSKLN